MEPRRAHEFTGWEEFPDVEVIDEYFLFGHLGHMTVDDKKRNAEDAFWAALDKISVIVAEVDSEFRRRGMVEKQKPAPAVRLPGPYTRERKAENIPRRVRPRISEAERLKAWLETTVFIQEITRESEEKERRKE
jgi:hypothetical protein